MEYILNDFQGIPIQTFVRNAYYPSSMYIAKSVICIEDMNFSDKYLTGFSLKANKDDAIKISMYEALERFFSTFEFHGECSFEGYVYGKNEYERNFNFWDVLLSSPKASIPNGVNLKSSSGVAFHFNKKSCENNCILELLERHIVGTLWYLDKFSLKKILPTSIILDSFELDIYTIADIDIPFILSTIYHKSNSLFICGSALSCDFNTSKNKALEEVYMLFDTIQKEEFGICNSEKTKQKIISLSSVESLNKATYLRNKVGNYEQNSASSFYSIPQIMKKIDTDLTIYIVPLVETEDFTVCRAVSDDVHYVEDFRRKSSVIIDPFC